MGVWELVPGNGSGGEPYNGLGKDSSGGNA